MKKAAAMILLSLLLAQAADASSEPNWKEKKNKNGIVAYTAEIESNEHLAFKGVTTLKGISLNQLLTLMQDVNQLPRWLYTIYDPKLIRQEDAQTRVVWMKSATPSMLVSDRDMIIRLHIIKSSEKSARIELTGLPNEIPKEKGFVRVPFFQGEWTLDESANGLNVTYSGVIDPGGAVPTILANAMAVDTPYETLKKLKAAVEPK